MFQFQASFAGVSASGTYVQLPTAPVTGIVQSVEGKAHKDEPGAMVAEFTILVTEAGLPTGATRRINMRIPDGTDKGQKVLPLWRTALESIGVAPAALDAGIVGISQDTFKGKSAFFFHTAADRAVNPNSYDDLMFLTPKTYTDRKATIAAAPTSAAGAPTVNSAGATVTAQPGAASPATAQPIDTKAIANNLLL